MNNGQHKDVERRILEALAEPRTFQEVAEIVQMAIPSVRKRLKVMMEKKLIHISEYRPAMGWQKEAPHYLVGNFPNAPYPRKDGVWRPKIRDAQEGHQEAQGEAIEGEDEEWDWKPRRKCLEPVLIKRDFLVAALFGEYRP